MKLKKVEKNLIPNIYWEKIKINYFPIAVQLLRMQFISNLQNSYHVIWHNTGISVTEVSRNGMWSVQLSECPWLPQWEHGDTVDNKHGNSTSQTNAE